MRQLLMRGLMVIAVWCAAVIPAYAVSLGGIEVASHLGEPFFARIPLQLSADEKAAKIEVDIASRADYRVLETYRDPVLDRLQVSLVRDRQGLRVQVRSNAALNTPFFNLILRVREGHFTQFKKFPVLLDLPKVVLRGKGTDTPAPVRKAGPEVSPVQLVDASKQRESANQSASFHPFDGWARASVYGPIVHGDMLSTVAQRLRIDNRYTLAQVMVALYEKNKDKFAAHNFNLLKQGSMLHVPTAAEVERHTPREASLIFEDHQRRWRALVKQPRYAAEKRAQEQRYKPRIRMGGKALGSSGERSAQAAVAQPAGKPAVTAQAEAPIKAEAREQQPTASTAAPQPREAAPPMPAPKPAQSAEAETTSVPPARLAAPRQPTLEPSMSAETRRRMDRLEHQLKRLQAQLALVMEEKRQAEARQQWLLMALGGMGILLLLLLLWIMRTRRSGTVQPAVATAPAAPADPVEKPATERMSATEAAGVSAPTVAQRDEREEASRESGERVRPTSPERPQAPAVDPLSDVDVYLRYGMEDEALKTVESVLAREPKRLDAHLKKLLVLSFHADPETMRRHVADALAALDEAEHARFRQELATMGLDDFLSDATETPDTPARAESAMEGDAHPAQGNEDIAHDEPAPSGDEELRAQAPVAEASASGPDELEFDISDFDLDKAMEQSPAGGSGLVEHNEQALSFDSEAGSQNDKDDVRRLDELLKRLEDDDDPKR